jgi:hypothetical protein
MHLGIKWSFETLNSGLETVVKQAADIYYAIMYLLCIHVLAKLRNKCMDSRDTCNIPFLSSQLHFHFYSAIALPLHGFLVMSMS